MVNGLEEAKQATQSWAVQTLIFAMNIKSKEKGTLKDTLEFMSAVRNEAISTAKELWETAVSAVPARAKLGKVILTFAKKVLDWCADHRKEME